MAANQTAGVMRVFAAQFGDKQGALALLEAPPEQREFFKRLGDRADLPDSQPAGVTWTPFVRGWPETDRYVFALTRPDTGATRPGMVTTRMLTFSWEELDRCDDLTPVFQALREGYAAQPMITMPPADKKVLLSPLAAGVVNMVFQATQPVAIIGQAGFDETVAELWRRLPATLRRGFSFGFSFTPADLKGSVMQLVAVPADCEPRWRTYGAVFREGGDAAVIALAEAQLAKCTEEAMVAFLAALDLQFRTFGEFQRYARLWSEWEQREREPEIAYALVRSLGTLIPDPQRGAEQKRLALQLAADRVVMAPVEGVLSQRSVKAAAFPQGAALLGQAVSKWVEQRFEEQPTEGAEDLRKVIAAITTTSSAEWSAWVKEGMRAAFARFNERTAQMVWAVLSDDFVFREVTRQLARMAQAEKLLVKSLPASVPAELMGKLEAWCKECKWLSLCAVLLQQRVGFGEAVTILQGEAAGPDRTAALEALYAGEKPEVVWAAAAKEPSLVPFAARAALASPALWSSDVLETTRWLEVLEAAAVSSPRFLLTANSAEICSRIFDAWVTGSALSPQLLRALEAADLLDLNQYGKRVQLWPKLPEPFRKTAVLRTSKAWLRNYYAAYAASPPVLEPELVEAIFSPAIRDLTFPVDSEWLGQNGLLLVEKWGEERDCENWIVALAQNNQKSPPSYTAAGGALIHAKRWVEAMRIAKIYDEKNGHHYLWPLWRPLYNSLGLLDRFSLGIFHSSLPTPVATHGAAKDTVEAVFLTALAVEFSAVTAQLTDRHERVENGTLYELGRFAVSPSQSCWIAVVQTGMGNAPSAMATERALSFFKPTFAFFVGIAGGLKDDLSLGAVVAADKVYGYELGKSGEEFLTRPDTPNPTYEAVQRAHAVERKAQWQARIKPAPVPLPKAFVKPIAAGEKVLISEKSESLQRIRKTYSDAYAVAMEEYGFGVASRTHPQVCFAVVRGISDLIENKASADASGSHEVAARHATAFALEMLAGLLTARANKAEL